MSSPYEEILKILQEAMQAPPSTGQTTGHAFEIPVGISNRHVHFSQADFDTLFGVGYVLTKIKDLSQPGQYACKETVTICGPRGAIENVRILGPVRGQTQVEILKGDCFKLGVTAPIRLSGDLQGTPGITIIGPKGSVQTKEGVIVAQRHLHMTVQDASYFGVQDGQIVAVEYNGLRGGTFSNVIVRANDTSGLEFHIDTEEANAMDLNSQSKIKIIGGN